jgi:PAS domain S-box-containing protein
MMNDGDRAKILLVDDQPAKLLTYEAILKELGEELITANSAQQAFDCLLKNDFALVLVDVCMPDLDGFQLASMMREHPRFEKTPIIFISAIHLTDFDHLRGYERGAVDYIPVPIVPEILRAKVKVFVELYRKTRALQNMNRVLEERISQRTAELEASNLQLQESEARLRLASEAANFGTYDFDAHTGQLHCSLQLRDLVGLTPDHAEDLDLEAFIRRVHPDDRDAVRRCLTGAERDDEDRHSLEFRVVHPGSSVRWLYDRGRVFYTMDAMGNSVIRAMGTMLDVTDRKQIEERQLLLMAELDHRVKNILANVSAIAKLSSRRKTSVDEFVEALDARIQAVSRAHSLLRRDNWNGISLRDYVSEILSPFTSSKSANITLEGDEIHLKPKAAQSLALVFHELATNAAKYGALSVPGGRIDVRWSRKPEKGLGWIKLAWTEHDGPPIDVPVANGFGLTVIRAASAELNAEVDHNLSASGVTLVLDGPFEQTSKLDRVNGGGACAPEVTAVRAREKSEKYRILLVEDETLIALQVQFDLEDAGHVVIGPAQSLSQAVELAKSKEMDFALLDLRLGDDLSTPVADHLLIRGIPFAFATGYQDRNLLPKHLQGVRCLAKPYPFGAVARLVDKMMVGQE